MRGKKSNNRAPSFSMVHIALLILCAVLITTHLTGGIAARYTSETTATASASVIKFGNITLTETGDFNAKGNFYIIPGVAIHKAARVDFEGSESATYVFAEMKLNGWETIDHRNFYVSKGSEKLLSWNVSEEWVYLKSNGNTHIYYYLGAAVAPVTPVSSNLIMHDTINVSEEITAEDIKGSQLQGITITFRATAVQSIGFENAEAAWDSVSGK